MSEFPFSFTEMSDWYENARDNPDYFSNDQKLIATFIAPSEKYEQLAKRWVKRHKLDPLRDKNMGYKGAFIKQNITKDAIRKIEFLKDSKAPYPNGLYVIKQDQDNLFFVFPIEKINQKGETLLAADHYSVPFVKSKKEIHMHVTNYLPNFLDITTGTTTHLYKNIFKDGALLPHTGYNTSVFAKAGPHSKDDLLDLMRTYELAKDQEQIGGASGRVVKQKAKKAKARGTIKKHISVALEGALLQKKIKRLNIIGVNNGAEWHFVVDVIHRSNAAKSNNGIVEANTDFAFKMTLPTSWSRMQNKILQAISNLPS